MSDNVSAADNQQGSPLPMQNRDDPSETTRRSPFVDTSVCKAYLQGALHDGSQNRGNRIRFTQKYPVWLQRLKKLLSHLEHESWMYKEGAERIKQILTRSNINCGKIHNPSSRVDPEYWRFYVSTKSHVDFARKITSLHPIKKPILRERMKI
jgi:hypothetical protein